MEWNSAAASTASTDVRSSLATIATARPTCTKLPLMSAMISPGRTAWAPLAESSWSTALAQCAAGITSPQE